MKLVIMRCLKLPTICTVPVGLKIYCMSITDIFQPMDQPSKFTLAIADTNAKASYNLSISLPRQKNAEAIPPIVP